jgi:hypothetical protein
MIQSSEAPAKWQFELAGKMAIFGDPRVRPVGRSAGQFISRSALRWPELAGRSDRTVGGIERGWPNDPVSWPEVAGQQGQDGRGGRADGAGAGKRIAAGLERW